MTAGWNLLVYALAGNADEHHKVLDAIEGMRAAVTSDACRIAVQVMVKGRTTRYWISSADRTRSEVLPDVVDASRQTPLTSFVNAAAKQFPGAATALTLWAHGSGLDHVHDYGPGEGPEAGDDGGLGGDPRGSAGSRGSADSGGSGGSLARWPVRAVDRPMLALRPWRYSALAPLGYGCRWGPDPNSGRFLTNVTMKKAIAASLHGRVDLLGLNACWMAALEVEYELRSIAGVAVASQVYAKPWPYRAIVEAVVAQPAQSAEQLARAIVGTVKAEIDAGTREDAVSAFQAGRAMDDLAAAFDVYARRVTQLIDSDWDAVRAAVMDEALRIDDPLQVDLASLVKVLGQKDDQAREAAHAVAWQLHAMRVANAAHKKHLRVQGLSVFCPKSTEVDLADAYQGTEFRANSWGGFLARFQARLAAS